MSTHLSRARDCAEQIDYYHAHAGAAGYSQASYYEQRLGECLKSAFRSRRGKADVPSIEAIIERLRPKMAEMKQRENEGLQP